MCCHSCLCAWTVRHEVVVIHLSPAMRMYIQNMCLSVCAYACPAVHLDQCVFNFILSSVSFASVTTLSQMLQSPWGWYCLTKLLPPRGMLAKGEVSRTCTVKLTTLKINLLATLQPYSGSFFLFALFFPNTLFCCFGFMGCLLS